MNKAITEGLDLMPPAFLDGLDVWSEEDGTPGGVTYDISANGTLVASDPDFGPALEIVSAASPQRLRYTGETPILPGCYLEVTARVKLISGPFPNVRIAAFAGDSGGVEVNGLVTTGPQVSLDTYGRVYTVRAIIGSGNRTGVDMVWGTEPVFGHMGLDILGSTGAVVRIESIDVADMTSVFHRDLMDWVDVRDFGAIGDGVTDDADAFESADAAAAGRSVLVSDGTFFLGRNITMLSPCRFEGSVLQDITDRFILRANFDFESYFRAFKDETLAFKKALQALFNFADHESLDLGGRRIDLDGPINVRELIPTINNFTSRRAIRNGQLSAVDTSEWDPDVVVSNGTFDSDNPTVLTNVADVASIAVGSHVDGFGIPREIYVLSKDDAAQTVTCSESLGRVQTTQSYTFTRWKYILDFSEVPRINSFNIDDIEFDCNALANSLFMPQAGIAWQITDCWFSRPRTRGISSHGTACQGISIDRNQFNAPDDDELVQDRNSIGFNVNANDAKVRANRCVQMKHFGVFHGSGNLIVGNHFWQLDNDAEGERTAGLILTRNSAKTTITGNYIDAMSIELTNERTTAELPSGSDFGNLTITGNIFTHQTVPDWFTYIVLKPVGTDHQIKGISVIGNAFKGFGSNGTIDRVERIDTSDGDFDHTLTKDLTFQANDFVRVSFPAYSPATVEISETAASNSWRYDLADILPFGGRAMTVEGLVAKGRIEDDSDGLVSSFPYVNTEVGSEGQEVNVRWPVDAKGVVRAVVRSDNPI